MEAIPSLLSQTGLVQNVNLCTLQSGSLLLCCALCLCSDCSEFSSEPSSLHWTAEQHSFSPGDKPFFVKDVGASEAHWAFMLGNDEENPVTHLILHDHQPLYVVYL